MEINSGDYPGVLSLAVGASMKIPHIGCSESACMKVSTDVAGISFYCFKCGEYHFESSFNSPREKLRRQATLDANIRMQADESYDIPADSSQILPSKALAWLGAGGWTLEMQRRYNIGWSEKLNRVILPVQPFGYTARAVEKWQKPKYIEKAPKDAYWMSMNAPATISACIICEDILSAGRCGEFMQAYSILGTSLSTAFLMHLIQYKTIYLWLDNDRGGLAGVKKAINRLRLLCADVRVVTSNKDPKFLTSAEIKERLL